MRRLSYLNNLIKPLIFISVLLARPYKGGELRTLDTFRYGRYEVSMKSAAGSGIVSSFFTYRDYWDEGLSGGQHWNEIDWELLGQEDDNASTNIIIQNQWDYVQELNIDFNPHEDFHTYAIEWTPNDVLFFIDNQLVRTVDNFYADSLYHYHKIMMNLWQPTATSWVGPFNSDILPVYAYYDWVKYHAYVPGSGNVGTNNDFILLWTDEFDYIDPARWERATHTFDGNNVDFIEENVVFEGGYMILCMTTLSNTGYNGDPLSSRFDYGIPNIISMGSAYPNPFNNKVNFPIYVQNSGLIEYQIFDLNGRVLSKNNIITDTDGIVYANWNGMDSNGRYAPSGTYIIQLINNDISFTQKIIFLK